MEPFCSSTISSLLFSPLYYKSLSTELYSVAPPTSEQTTTSASATVPRYVAVYQHCQKVGFVTNSAEFLQYIHEAVSHAVSLGVSAKSPDKLSTLPAIFSISYECIEAKTRINLPFYMCVSNLYKIVEELTTLREIERGSVIGATAIERLQCVRRICCVLQEIGASGSHNIHYRAYVAQTKTLCDMQTMCKLIYALPDVTLLAQHADLMRLANTSLRGFSDDDVVKYTDLSRQKMAGDFFRVFNVYKKQNIIKHMSARTRELLDTISITLKAICGFSDQTIAEPLTADNLFRGTAAFLKIENYSPEACT